MPKLLRARTPLDDREERQIRRLAGARHAPADWIQRATIITMSWDGARVPAIAARVGCHPATVRRRLRRFSADGIEGLADLPGSGRKPRITQEERSQIIALAKSPPPGHPHWQDGGELRAADEQGRQCGRWTHSPPQLAARESTCTAPRSAESCARKG
ncbi:helix-turn-helix domain-containing protein [Nonomuraea sp. NPDC049684]|uniref:helix-turn-helix domain-containing protein n=1 Tax=Nonomuraea sp. NPDC049684 TaxID=3364356 RepID=UPI00379AC843